MGSNTRFTGQLKSATPKSTKMDQRKAKKSNKTGKGEMVYPKGHYRG